MLFETYEIDAKNSAAKNAIQNNGLIEFDFYKEKQIYITRGIGTNITYTNYPYYNPSITINGSNTTFTTSNFSSDINYKSSINCCGSSLNLESLNMNDESEEKLETGRIEKGEVSNQNFVNVNVDFENYSFYSIQYKLLPVSAKKEQPYKVRQYCTQCGKRIKESYLYCPLCGAKNE